MKNVVKTLMSCSVAAILLAGCKDADFVNPYDVPITDLALFTGTIPGLQTRSGLNTEGETVWSADDVVGVFAGEAANRQFVIQENLSNSAIFSVREGDPIPGPIETLYSYYPYSGSVTMAGTTLNMTLPATQPFAEKSFADGLNPMAGANTTRSLVFRYLCGVVKIKLSETVFGTVTKITLSSGDSKVMAGSATVDMDYEYGSTPKLTVAANGPTELVLDCGEEGVSITSAGTLFHFVVPPGTYEDLTFRIENTDEAVFESKIVGQTVVGSGIMTDVGDAAIYIEEFFYGKANCLLINTINPLGHSLDVTPYYTTDFKGYAYEYNTRDDLTFAASAGLVWQTSTSLITNIALSADKKTVTFNVAEGKTGNALIAIYDQTGKILWSFHIWITPTVTRTYPAGSYQVLDRNLGAVSATPADKEKTYGLYYQWGRKDPFPLYVNRGAFFGPGNNAFEFTAVNTSAGVTHTSVAATPTVFYIKTSAPMDWVFDGSPNKLWGNPTCLKDITQLRKSIYDPCPEGYMLPAGNILTANGVVNGNDGGNGVFPYDAANQGRTLMTGTFGDWWPNARVVQQSWTATSNVVGRYWYSGAAAAAGVYDKGNGAVYGDGNTVFPDYTTGHRAQGMSVRCVRIVLGQG